MLDSVDVAQRYLHRNPQHRRPDSRIVSGDVIGYWKVYRSVDVPVLNGDSGKIPQDILTAELAVRADNRFRQAEDRLTVISNCSTR